MFITFLLLLVFGISTPAQASLEMEWKAGLLSITAEEELLSKILENIAYKTGLKVQGSQELQQKISVQFSQLSLGEGLKKILVDINYILIKDKSSQKAMQPDLVLIISGKKVNPDQQESLNEEKTSTEQASPNQELNVEMLHVLAQQGDKEALRQAISNADPDIQVTALELLAGLEPEESAALLIESTKSQSAQTRLRAIELLYNTDQVDGSVILPILGKAMVDSDPTVRRYAIQTLAQRDSLEALEYLRQNLHNSDPSIRMTTLETVVRSVPPERAIALLQEAALDENRDISSAASAWLDQLRQNN